MKERILDVVDGGGRIYLRGIGLADVTDDYYNWMNDEEVIQFLEARFSSKSLEAIRAFVDNANNDPDTVLFAICLKDKGLHIGNVKIGRINRTHQNAEISIMIGEKKYWGKGYGAEAIRLMANYAFSVLNLNKLTAECYANNLGSFNAFKKAGFKEEGVRKSHYSYKGNYVDAYVLGLICSELENA